MRPASAAPWLALLIASPLITLATPSPSAAPLREVRAVRAERLPLVDGRIEPDVWGQAPEINGLEQQRPDNGQACSESTRVWILYDDDALYVAARMDDRERVTRLLGRRDTFLESDWFGVLLDPQHDRRSGNGFFVNPDGVQYDEVISNDTDEDTSWDGVWQSAVSIDGAGWSAEMRIPFSQLRFPERDAQTWGLNFIRWIKRRQEQARLVSHPRNEPGFASRFGDLVGITGVRPRPRIEVTPFVTTKLASSRTVLAGDPLNERTSTGLDGGLDLRWTSRSNLTFGAAVNPDFGQVEVDPAILDLSQFEQFFPEKRPFFLEGAKLYNFGGLATVYPSPFRFAHPILFYSRRIGRVPQGNPRLAADWIDTPDETSIRGAGKLLYRTASGVNVALLDAVTGAEYADLLEAGLPAERRAVEPLTNSVAARWTRDLGDRTRVGALLTAVHRRDDVATAFLPSRTLVAGVDAYGWLGDRQLLVDAMVAGSEAAGGRDAITQLQRSPAHQFQRSDAAHLELDPTREVLRGWGGKLSVSRERGMWRWQAQGESYSPGFDVNDLGFFSRADMRAAHATVTWFDVAQRRWTRNNRVTLGRYGSWTQGGERIGNGIAGDVATTFTNYWTAALQGAWSRSARDDREARGGPAIRRPVGWSGQLRITSDPRKRIWAEAAQTLGTDDEGGRTRITRVSLTVRPRPNLSASIVGTVTSNVVGSKWVASIADPAVPGGVRHVFARLDDRRLEIAPRVDWTIRTDLTFQLYLQPLAAAGTYRDFKELRAPAGGYSNYGQGGSTITRTDDPREYRVDPDGPGPASPIVVRDPDFTLRSLRGNAVVRWEMDGATTLFLVWNQKRSARDVATSEGRLDDLERIRDVPADDRILLKVSRRFDLPR
jgi:hypothetical protein